MKKYNIVLKVNCGKKRVLSPLYEIIIVILKFILTSNYHISDFLRKRYSWKRIENTRTFSPSRFNIIIMSTP